MIFMLILPLNYILSMFKLLPMNTNRIKCVKLVFYYIILPTWIRSFAKFLMAPLCPKWANRQSYGQEDCNSTLEQTETVYVTLLYYPFSLQDLYQGWNNRLFVPSTGQRGKYVHMHSEEWLGSNTLGLTVRQKWLCSMSAFRKYWQKHII